MNKDSKYNVSSGTKEKVGDVCARLDPDAGKSLKYYIYPSEEVVSKLKEILDDCIVIGSEFSSYITIKKEDGSEITDEVIDNIKKVIGKDMLVSKYNNDICVGPTKEVVENLERELQNKYDKKLNRVNFLQLG